MQLSYEFDGVEEYWGQWKRDDVLEAEALTNHQEDVLESETQDTLNSWLWDRGHWNQRGYYERSERWYEYPLDYLCMKGKGENL
jgi:hypothetical protein